MEEAILALLRAEPDKTLAILYKKHKPACVAYMKRMYHDRGEIDYIFTEAMIHIYEKVRDPGFVLTCPLQSYLNTFCKYQIWNRQKKAGRFPDNQGDIEEFLAHVADGFGEADQEINELADIAEQVLEEMQANSPKCYEILKRFYHLKESMHKIALDMGYSNADNAKTQKYKCLIKFKAAFLKRYTSEQFKQK